MYSSNGTRDDFTDTNWSLVRELQAAQPERRQAAMTALVETYRGPIYAFLRRQGCNRDKAAELTQGFFAEKVLDGNLFDRADPDRARLRALIRTALKHFRIDEHRRATARVGGSAMIAPGALDHEEQLVTNFPGLTPDDAFSKRWAAVVLEEALRRCRRYYAERGRQQRWDAFFARTVRPIVSGARLPAQSDVADEVGLPRAGDVANAVHDVRRHMQMFLLEVVAETVSDPATAPDELRELLESLRS